MSSKSFFVQWNSPKFGRVLAGSTHDWVPDTNHPGVLRFESDASARRFISEYLAEMPMYHGQISVVEDAGFDWKPGKSLEKSLESRKTTRKEYMDSKSWSNSGTWASVRSKKIKGIRYHKSARRLFVEYKDGSVRSYERIHPMTARALFNTLKVDDFMVKRIALKHMTTRLK